MEPIQNYNYYELLQATNIAYMYRTNNYMYCNYTIN